MGSPFQPSQDCIPSAINSSSPNSHFCIADPYFTPIALVESSPQILEQPVIEDSPSESSTDPKFQQVTQEIDALLSFIEKRKKRKHLHLTHLQQEPEIPKDIFAEPCTDQQHLNYDELPLQRQGTFQQQPSTFVNLSYEVSAEPQHFEEPAEPYHQFPVYEQSTNCMQYIPPFIDNPSFMELQQQEPIPAIPLEKFYQPACAQPENAQQRSLFDRVTDVSSLDFRQVVKQELKPKTKPKTTTKKSAKPVASSNRQSLMAGKRGTKLSTLPFFMEFPTTSEETFKKFVHRWNHHDMFSWCLVFSSKVQTRRSSQRELEDEDYTFLPKLCEIQALCVAWDDQHVYYIDLSALSQDAVSPNSRWTAIKKVFGNMTSKKVLCNMKSQLKVLFAQGIQVNGPLMDPKIAAWLINSDVHKEKGLDQLCEEFLRDSKNISLFTIPDKPCRAAYVAHKSLLVMKKLNEILMKDKSQYYLFTSVEMPLIPVLARMESVGFGFVNEICQQGRDQITAKLKYLEDQAFQIAGRKFELTSPAEVAQVLFEDLKCPLIGQKVDQSDKKQNRKQKYSTAFAHQDDKSTMKRIYPLIFQTSVPTGRLSFTNPNLQAVTHEVSFVPASCMPSYYGQDNTEVPQPAPKEITVSVRDAFVATPGYVLMSADYSQLELRLMAHFSKDTLLLDIFSKGGIDVFKQVAGQWLGKPVESVTSDEREAAKHICYGIMYGMGPSSLAEDIKISKEEAKNFIDSFKNRYVGVKKFLIKVIEDCKRDTYVTTIMGRKRYLPGILAPQAKIRCRAERQAVNTICQGSAADLIKIAMIQICKQLREMKADAEMLLQIHDELLFEVKEEELPNVQVGRLLDLFTDMKAMVKRTMERALTLDIPLPVNISVGLSWGSLQRI